MNTTKIRVDAVTIGQTVKGNLGQGSHLVASIKQDALSCRGGASASVLLFFNAAGVEFFAGRISAKATILD